MEFLFFAITLIVGMVIGAGLTVWCALLSGEEKELTPEIMLEIIKENNLDRKFQESTNTTSPFYELIKKRTKEK